MTTRCLTMLALAALAACGGDDDGDDPGPGTNVIAVENNRFTPAALTVATGTTVTFRWASGSVAHNVTPSASNPSVAPESPDLPALQSAPFEFSVPFAQAGTYRFYCSQHGAPGNGTPTGMAGTITVQ